MQHNNNNSDENLYSQKISWRPVYNGTSRDLTIRIMRVTPAKARELLRTMETNRNKRTAALKKIRAAIAVGKWFPTGDTIKMTNNGVLVDGQHRLEAIGEGIDTFDLVCVSGFDIEDINHFDQNSSRTMPDNLKLKGRPNATVLSGGLNFFYKLRANELAGVSPAGYEQIDFDQLFAETGVVDEDVVYGIQQKKDPNGGYSIKPVIALRFLFSEYYGRQKTEVFFDRFIYGKDNAKIEKNNPANMLSKKLNSYRSGAKNTDITERFKRGTHQDNWVAIYMYEAFQAYLEERNLSRWHSDKIVPMSMREHIYWRSLNQIARSVYEKHENKFLEA